MVLKNIILSFCVSFFLLTTVFLVKYYEPVEGVEKGYVSRVMEFENKEAALRFIQKFTKKYIGFKLYEAKEI
jgi:hypothetical protein